MTDTVPPSWDDVPLTDEHILELESSAITPEVALEHGVYSITDPAASDLPESLDWVVRKPGTSPLLVHTLNDVRGMTVYQVKPAPGSVTDADGKELKYVSEKGDRAPVMFARKEVGDPECELFVEGTKQSLAVAAWAPDNMSVYGFPGITGWSRDGLPPGELYDIVRGKHVVIVPDADASTNRAVYDGAKALGDAASGFGAATVHYARVPGTGTAGIDDVLAKIPEDQRGRYISDLIRLAQRTPADRRPPAKKQKLDRSVKVGGSRPVIPINGSDFNDVATGALGVLKQQDNLYLANDQLSQIRRDDKGRMRVHAVEKGDIQRILAEGARLVTMGKERVTGQSAPSALVDLLLSSAGEFPPLTSIFTNPVYTSDMRLVIEPGYDPETHLYLDLDPTLAGMAAPSPTEDDVKEAVKLLHYWLQDFPFREEADFANYISLLFTQLLRVAFPTVPGFALNANGKGTGKTLLAELGALVLTGRSIETNVYPSNEEEATKVLVSMFASGRERAFFDETPEVNSKVLNAVLTSSSWGGRILRKSLQVEWDNKMTFFFAANNIQILGDARRRFVMVTLHFEGGDASDRTDFEIPNITQWTKDHRQELLMALLTLVEWWKLQGMPKPSNPPLRMGKFEDWQDVVSGILECAGIKGHLANVQRMRNESDWVSAQTYRHLAWLRGKFGTRTFKVGEAYGKSLEDGVDYQPLPGLESECSPSRLGREYAKLHDVLFDELRIVDAGSAGRGVRKWQIIETGGGASGDPDGDPDDPGGGPGDDSGDGLTNPSGPPPPPPTGPTPPVQPTAPADVPSVWRASSAPITKLDYADKAGRRVPDLVDVDEGRVRPVLFFDLETCDADDLYTHSGPGFVRLAAWAVDDGEVHTTTDIDLFANILHGFTAAGGLVCAHNGVSFDLAALHHHHGLNVDWMIEHGQVRDTLLMARQTDPPGSGNADAKRYGLDPLATRLLDAGKLASDGQSALKKLEDEHGGYGAIPVDDPTYVAYAKQDVELLRGIFQYLKCDSYVLEEHRRLWSLTGITRTGWRVDSDAVHDQIAVDEARAGTLTEKLRKYLETVTGTEIKGSPVDSKVGKESVAEALVHHGVADDDIPRAPKGGPSMKADDLAELAEKYSGNEPVAWLCETVGKLVSTRSVPTTIRKYTRADGRVHPGVSASQNSGRISVTRPGLTVMGARKRGNLLERRLLVPDSDDHVLISADLSGIDGRAMAVMSQDPDYLANFAPGVDVHAQTALDLFGDESRRDDAKAVNHGLNYGMGSQLLAKTSGLSVAEAKATLERAKLAYTLLERLKQSVRDRAEAIGLVRTPAGRWVRVNQAKAYTAAPAALGQSLARDLLMAGVLRLPVDLRKQIRGVVHDEIVLSVPRNRVDEARSEVLAALQFTYHLPGQPGTEPVEILAEVSSSGGDWAECYADDKAAWPEIRRDHRALPDCDDMECSWHHHELDQVEESSQ